MKVLITGAGGQLGAELTRASWAEGTALFPLPSAALDITDQAGVAATIHAIAPDVIINAAAYTAVDRAEDDEVAATAVNAAGVTNLANAANAVEAMLIHLSTDYVFDGSKSGWYIEDDPPAPLGAYGRSKLAGEEAASSAARGITLRTGWVYGALGPNFVATMLTKGAEQDELRVVGDQIGCPTAAPDLAAAIVGLVAAIRGTDEGPVQPAPARLYHLASPTPASWYELAVAVLEVSSVGFSGTITEVTTDQYPTRACRPANSCLDSSRLAADFGISLAPWREVLPLVVAELDGRHLEAAATTKATEGEEPTADQDAEEGSSGNGQP
ncbi:MAG: dTDP-4-dehydrorhamnose reductase [Actinomycetia bacterium]|nr:dTDP-4-dehydrorhamnose reductase [Actinomycetes bacterium]